MLIYISQIDSKQTFNVSPKSGKIFDGIAKCFFAGGRGGQS
eukprot:UN03783